MLTLTQPIRLRCLINDTVVVTFKEGLQGRPTFSKDYEHLEAAMKVVGIVIPVYERSKYLNTKSNRAAVYLNDENFGQAFYEIYFKNANWDPKDFVWEKIEKI